MPAISLTKSYQDGDILVEADLDNLKTGVENFFNVTKIDDDNIQDNGITASSKLDDLSISTAKYANASITKTKLDASAGSSREICNATLATSVGSNALVISLKTKAGTDASSSDKVTLGFRSATATSGLYLQREVTGALSLTVSAGSTLGHTSGADEWIYVYAIDNAGTVELAVSSKLFDEGTLVNTTAEGAGGAADSFTVMYSATARTGVACRLLGRLKSNQATAGTWATAIAEIATTPFQTTNLLYSAEVLSGGLAGANTFAFGTYTPTVTNVANVAAIANASGKYIRIGDLVMVTVYVDLDCSSASPTTSQVTITLPIASTFTVINDVTGTGCSQGTSGGGTGPSGGCVYRSGNLAQYDFTCFNGANLNHGIVFMYQVK